MRNSNITILVFFLMVNVSVPSLAGGFPGRFSGEVTAEYRYYPSEGEFGSKEKGRTSIVTKPEYSLSWNYDRSVILFAPFARFDQFDSERSHYDIREFNLVESWKYLELRVGISKVFWGVTESRHLIDVINQTDFVENLDGEQKLGQPMINPTLVTPLGNINFYVLPYFRERSFPGEEGRFRGNIVVNTSKAYYMDEDKNKHIDYALRWSSSWQDLEWALSYFSGTDREPDFQYDGATNTLIPVYGQSRQAGLEVQYIYKELLTKAEFLRKDSFVFNGYSAATIGFEYTFSNIGQGQDIGVLYEWLYDSRRLATPSGLDDDSFIAMRLALNDVDSTQVLAGAIISNQSQEMSLYRMEASRRIAGALSLGIEVNIIDDPKPESLLYQFRYDDYIQLTLSSFF